MFLTLYKTLDDDNVINKTLTSATSIELNLKRDTDIYRPQITLTKIVGVDYLDYNYCHLSEIDRFYFIRDIQVLNNSIFKLDCQVDVLESFKADILASEGVYKRRISAGDYGQFTLDSNGDKEVIHHLSNVELIPVTKSILSTLKWAY